MNKITVHAIIEAEIHEIKREVHIVTSIMERGEWREVSRIIRHGDSCTIETIEQVIRYPKD